MTVIAQQLVNGVMLGAVYMTVAVAFTLTIGILNFLNFTIPGLFMLSAMVAWSVLARGFLHFAGPAAWVLALVIGAVVAILASLLVERFAYRYLKMRYGDATEHAIPIVSSLGFLLVIENLVGIYLGTDPQPFPTPFAGASVRVAGLLVSVPQVTSLVVTVALVAALTTMLARSRIGRALRAIAENPDGAAVSVAVRRTAAATRPLGRRELKPFSAWTDGRPETELNFKFYRQATNKVVGISEAAAVLLRGCCGSVRAGWNRPARPPAAERGVAADEAGHVASTRTAPRGPFRC